MSNLLQAARQFWYNNEPGTFDLDGTQISRQQIHVHGGPARAFNTCLTCQRVEWLSRIQQQNLYEPHKCKTNGKCHLRCGYQGDELWTSYHQDFWFSVGCDPGLNAPKALIVFRPTRKVRLYERFWAPYCDFLFQVFRRLLAQTCQVEVVQKVKRIDWSRYDFVIYQNLGDGFIFPKPPIKMVMIMYDLWIKDYQSIIDHFQPEYLLTPYPTEVKRNFSFSGKVHFYPLHDSTFFSRPNLRKDKKVDLILAGSNQGVMYGPRRELDKQGDALSREFAVEFSHRHGALRHRHTGPTKYVDGNSWVHYLNKWSEKLGSANYASFASFGDKNFQPLFAKYYEVFGSGAVPIVPQIPDLDLLGVKAMEHYIPLGVVWRNPKKWRYILRSHKKYRRLAENAVKWHKENEKRLLFDQFEALVQDVTGKQYPVRVY